MRAYRGILFLAIWHLTVPLASAQLVGEVKDPWLKNEIASDYAEVPNKGHHVVRFLVGDRVFVQVGPQEQFDRYREVLKLIHSKKRAVRLAAVYDLKGYGNINAARAITSLLGDPDFEVRETVAWALGEMGYRSAIRPLIDALEYTPGPVKDTIATSLQKLTGKRFGASYRRWWAWYEAVRRDF
jgi:hypothetical protein